MHFGVSSLFAKISFPATTMKASEQFKWMGLFSKGLLKNTTGKLIHLSANFIFT